MNQLRTLIVRPEVQVVLEEGPTSWGAYVPALPRCFAVGQSREEVEERIEEAITPQLEVQHDDALATQAMEQATGKAIQL